MRVRAKGNPDTYAGYYNYVRRRGGAVFDLLREKDFSAKWMERVVDATPKTPAPGEPTPAELAAEAKKAETKKADKQRGTATGDRDVI